MKSINEYLDLSDIDTVKKLSVLSEESKKELASEIVKTELTKVNNKLMDKNVQDKINKFSFKNPNKFKEFWKVQNNSVNEIKKSLDNSTDLSKNDKDDINEWLNDIRNISMIVGVSNAIMNSNGDIDTMISGIIGSIIGAMISASIVKFISEHWDPVSKKIKGNIKKTLSGEIFKSLKRCSKMNAKDLKNINTMDLTGKVNITENFSTNNILNEVYYLQTRLINSLIDFIVNVLRAPVYIFYKTRVSIDDYLQLQIMMIENNISTKDLDDKVKNKQQAWVDRFKKLSQKIQVDFKKAENETLSELKTKKPTYKDITKDSNISFEF